MTPAIWEDIGNYETTNETMENQGQSQGTWRGDPRTPLKPTDTNLLWEIRHLYHDP